MRPLRRDGLRPEVSLLLCLAMAAQVAAPVLAAAQPPAPPTPPAQAQPRDDSIQQAWDQVSNLRVEGQFAQAVGVLRGIIRDHGDNDEVLRHAYNQLAFTHLIAEDQTSLEAAAREALERFPDLSAPAVTFTDRLDAIYADLRREMFGALAITAPSGARVFLDEEYVGEIPVEIALLRTGSHRLRVTKAGHRDQDGAIQIEPNVRLEREISLERQRGRSWWLTRVGVGLAAGTAAAFALSGDDEPAAGPQLLPGPPDPPIR